jgi:fatty acid-binding protein DegV
VTVAPMTLRCGSVTLTDDPYAELAAAQALFDECRPAPVAEPPGVEAFTEIYTQLQKDADQIVSIHTSSLMTGTYENARQASQHFLGGATSR